MQDDKHYLMIKEFYSDARAERSQLLKMNHIDDGLVILESRQADLETKQAWCVHPIFQHDGDLFNSAPYVERCDKLPLLFTMEYRSIANAYLSKRRIYSLEDIELSPLAEVNEMLVADKIQNSKDFGINKQLYPNRDDLAQYFHNWLTRLKIDPEQYRLYCNLIDVKRSESVTSG